MSVFCSTIIPTVNRPTLPRAVLSVLEQEASGFDFEVIVVNDSGTALPKHAWQSDDRVRVINTWRRERSVARNSGAGVAKGEYLHFLDDDDWVLPGALSAFWNLSRTCDGDVAWLHGSYLTVDNQGTTVAEFHPAWTGNVFALAVAGESIPLQASLLKADCFFNVGGFDSRRDVLGVEDRDLGRRLALVGEVRHTTSLVAKIRVGEVGSTTVWASLPAADRLSRERALAAPEAFARLKGAIASRHLDGRLTRAYIASAAWNLKRRAPLTAAARACGAARCAGASLLTPEFWRGLRNSEGVSD